MPRRTGNALALALAAALTPAAARAGDVSFEASADRSEIPLDETVTVRVALDSPDSPSELKLPGGDMPDFDVVSRGQSTQNSFSLGGGGGMKLRQARTFTLVLRPRRTGTLTVPAATAVVQRRRYATRELRIEVTAPRGSSPRPPSADDLSPPPGKRSRAWRGWERDLSVRVVVDRRQAFLGEQVTASVYAVSPVEVVSVLGQRPPAFDGFWSEDLASPSRIEYQLRSIDGVLYRFYLLKKVALFPTRAGRLEIGSYGTELMVQLVGRDPFDFFPETRRVKRQSEPLSIEVKPLPAGAPPGFDASGVGQWTLAAEVSEKRVAAGEPVAYRLTASGLGNVRTLALPRLPTPVGAKAYDPTFTVRVAPEQDRFGGAKTVETSVVPERTGELLFPALEWHWFNPRSGRYQTARVPELRVEVMPGSPAAAAGAPAPGVNTLAAGLRPIRTEGDLGRPGRPPWRSPLFVVLLAGPVAVYLSAAAADRFRERLRRGDAARRTRRAGRLARRRLERARRLAGSGDDAAFHAEVSRALLGYAADKLGRPVAGMTRAELAAALAAAGAHPPALDALARALDACDAGRFGRGSMKPEEALAGAARAMQRLEEAEWRRGGARA